MNSKSCRCTSVNSLPTLIRCRKERLERRQQSESCYAAWEAFYPIIKLLKTHWFSFRLRYPIDHHKKIKRLKEYNTFFRLNFKTLHASSATMTVCPLIMKYAEQRVIKCRINCRKVLMRKMVVKGILSALSSVWWVIECWNYFANTRESTFEVNMTKRENGYRRLNTLIMAWNSKSNWET